LQPRWLFFCYNMFMIKVIIFDCNGVFTTNSLAENLDVFSKVFGFDRKKLEPEYIRLSNMAIMGRMTSLEVCQKLIEKFGMQTSAEEIKKVWVGTFVGAPDIDTYKYALELSREYRLCLFSNYSDIFDEISKKLKLDDLFSSKMIFISSGISLMKPDKRAFSYVLNKIGCQPEEVIFIDDQENNIEQALSMGITSILFKDTNQLKIEMAKLEKTVPLT